MDNKMFTRSAVHPEMYSLHPVLDKHDKNMPQAILIAQQIWSPYIQLPLNYGSTNGQILGELLIIS